MQPVKPKLIAFKLFGFALLSATLFSFSKKTGGDSFEIYLNKKLVLQQFVSQSSGVKSIQLDASNANDQIDIYYSHCGQIGKSRNIILKDGKNNVLKEWHFSDATGPKSSMSCKVKDILDLKNKNSVDKLNLYYSSKEIPNGRLLAAVILMTDNKATP